MSSAPDIRGRNFLPLLQERERLEDEIQSLEAQIDRMDDLGVDTHHKLQELQELRRKLSALVI